MNKLIFTNWYGNSTLTIEFDKDSDIRKRKDIIRSIMVFATFSEHSLDFLDEKN